MNALFPTLRPAVAALSFFALVGGLHGQTPTAPAQAQTPAFLPVHSAPVDSSSEDSRLRQMESIYQQQLRTKHIVQLGKYLTDLQAGAARATDPSPWRAEMARVQAIINSGGVVDLAAAVQALKTPQEMPAPTPMPMPRRKPAALLTLTPDLARRISPTPETSASPKAAIIGEMEWLLEAVPAGAYEVVLQYASPGLSAPLPVEVEFAGQKVALQLDTAQGTNDARTYRLLRLGQIVLPAEVRGQVLRLRAGTAETRQLQVRGLMITRTKSEN